MLESLCRFRVTLPWVFKYDFFVVVVVVASVPFLQADARPISCALRDKQILWYILMPYVRNLCFIFITDISMTEKVTCI